MALTVKICGLRTPEALDAALDVGADFVGFVFFPPSPRHLALDAARRLNPRVRGQAGKVALSVDASDAELEAIVEALAPDLLQLHGHETPARVVFLKQRFGLPVMKAVAIAEAADLDAIKDYEMAASRLLFDARPPRGATRPGGLGTPFDWRLLQRVETRLPFLLSGGLDAANVAQALSVTRAPGVDVSSGVERAPGEKDPDRIRAFVRAARAAAPAALPIAASTA